MFVFIDISFSIVSNYRIISNINEQDIIIFKNSNWVCAFFFKKKKHNNIIIKIIIKKKKKLKHKKTFPKNQA